MQLELKNIKKNYGETVALKGLSLLARSGEILGIIGPNGAGKSTVIKILAGEVTNYEGSILVDGKPWKDSGVKFGIVHQETKLYPNLTVAENLLIGREGNSIKRPAISQREKDMMKRLNIIQYENSKLSDCPFLVQQLCEICRAVLIDASLFLFDEPNSALTEKESVELFQQIHRLKEEGKIILLVTHRLKEVISNADRVVVIKNGEVATIFEKEHINEERLAQSLVVGERKSSFTEERKIKSMQSNNITDNSLPLVRIKNLKNSRGIFKDINIDIKAGEVMVIMGVEGSGAREILYSICGIIPATGIIELNNGDGTWSQHIFEIPFLQASRQKTLFQNLSIRDNLVMRLGYPEVVSCWGRMLNKRINETSAKLVNKYNILAASVNNPITSLSGGNQQKVAVATIMAKKHKMLVLEEPTRGVDIQSKAEIYSYIREYVNEGNAALVFCTEVVEAFELGDRVVVANNGNISQPLNVSSLGSVEELAANIGRLEINLKS